MLAAQQTHHMRLAIAQMDSDTAYMVFDFKQKFLAKDSVKVVTHIMARRECSGGEQVYVPSQTQSRMLGAAVSLLISCMWRFTLPGTGHDCRT